MNKALKTILSIVLALLCVFLVYKIYEGVMEPVRFEKDVNARKKVAIQQLKDIRDLQVATRVSMIVSPPLSTLSSSSTRTVRWWF